MKLAWNDDLSVGVESIDLDHKELIQFYGDLEVAVAMGREFEYIKSRLDFMCYYCIAHFGREEETMRSYGYPYVDEHIKSHNALQATFVELYEGYVETRSIERAERILAFLAGWLTKHILGEDMRVGKFIRECLAAGQQKAAVI